MQGGSVFSKLRLVLAFPSRIPEVLGTALTSSSNFFINFVIIQVRQPAAARLQSEHATHWLPGRGLAMLVSVGYTVY